MKPKEFYSCLVRGLGRTHLYLQEHDAEPYKNVILFCSLFNPVSDFGFEMGRTDYYYDLIHLTGDADWFRDRILKALREPAEGMDERQLMELALYFAREGDKQARQLLYEKCGEYASLGDSFMADSVIRLDGTEGFLYVANRLGEKSLSEPEFEDCDYLLMRLQEKIGCADVSELRMAARGRYPFVDLYLSKIKSSDDGCAKVKREFKAICQQTYEQLEPKFADKNNYRSCSRLETWGNQASKSDLAKAANDLLKQSDDNLILRYLSIFGDREFPFGPESLFPYVWNKNEQIADASLQALSHFKHPQVRRIGFTLIARNRMIDSAIKLFQNNYEKNDEKFFLQLLQEINNCKSYFEAASGLLEVIKANPTPLFKDVLIHLYNYNPSSVNRCFFVEYMIQTGTLPEDIKREAAFDCNDETRMMVRALKGGEL